MEEAPPPPRSKAYITKLGNTKFPQLGHDRISRLGLEEKLAKAHFFTPKQRPHVLVVVLVQCVERLFSLTHSPIEPQHGMLKVGRTSTQTDTYTRQ